MITCSYTLFGVFYACNFLNAGIGVVSMRGG